MAEQVFVTGTTDSSDDVAFGRVPGEAWYPAGGRNENMVFATAPFDTKQTIWDQGGIYTYLTTDTQLYVSSTNALDTAVEISIFGSIQGADGPIEVIRTVTTNGQVQVPLSGSLFRFYRAVVVGGVEPLGNLYFAESDTLTGGIPNTVTKIKAKMIKGLNSTQMCLYTIPAVSITGLQVKKALIKNPAYTVSKGGQVIWDPVTRKVGGVWVSQPNFGVYQSSPSFILNGISLDIGEDVEVRGKTDNNGTAATAFLDFKLSS